MNNILLHGLGQTCDNWNNVISYLNKNNIETLNPNIFQFCRNNDYSYNALYKSFSDYCDSLKGKVNLCGLSLGGLITLDYAKKNPDKVNSLIIIGVPYVIPKKLFKFQNFIFKLMPKKIFTEMGITKEQFISLINSMSKLEINKDLDKIKSKALIIYGSKDKANLKYADYFRKSLKESKVKIIKNSSHEVNKDNYHDLSKEIINFWIS